MKHTRGEYQTTYDTELAILQVLADNKEYAQYDLPQIIKKDYHTVLRHLKALEKAGTIRLVRKEQAKKLGKERNIFAITFKGLYVLLYYARNDKEKVESLVKKQPALLLTFRKWSLFVEADLEQVILDRVRSAIHYSAVYGSVALEAGLNARLLEEREGLEKVVDKIVLFDTLFGKEELRARLMEVYKSDEDLIRFIDECFMYQESAYEDFLDVKASWNEPSEKST